MKALHPSLIVLCCLPKYGMAFVISPTAIRIRTTFLQKYDGVRNNPSQCSTPKKASAITAATTTIAGKDAKDKVILPKKRNMSSLRKWGEDLGVQFSDGFDIISSTDNKDDDDDCGVQVTQATSAGTSILRIPKSIVFSSHDFLQNLSAAEGTSNAQQQQQREAIMKLLNKALDKLSTYPQFQEYKPELLLVLQLLMELHKGKDSDWYAWIQSLPTSFDTGVFMDEVELSVLPPVAKALAFFEQKKLGVFVEAIQAMQQQQQEVELVDIDGDDLNEQQSSFLAAFGNKNGDGENSNDVDVFDEKIVKWAFSIIFTRSWRYNAKGSDAAANIVPLGDMFNHKEPGNIFVKDDSDNDESKFVEMVLKEDVKVNDNLYLSYGLTNPHRLLIIFGFVDESIPEIFSQVVFTNPNSDLIALGCDDRSKMVYRTSDGAIANSVWDVLLYTLLVSKPTEQEELIQAHVDGDAEKKAAIHAKYALEVSLLLKNHVEETISNVNDPFETLRGMEGSDDGEEDNLEVREEKKRLLVEQHPKLLLIQKHNAFLRNVFLKVKDRLNGMIMMELEKRKQNSK